MRKRAFLWARRRHHRRKTDCRRFAIEQQAACISGSISTRFKWSWVRLEFVAV